jgi:hypothetical protein
MADRPVKLDGAGPYPHVIVRWMPAAYGRREVLFIEGEIEPRFGCALASAAGRRPYRVTTTLLVVRAAGTLSAAVCTPMSANP